MHAAFRSAGHTFLCLLSIFISCFTVAPVVAAETNEPRTAYVLAVSWQPGFCETRPQRAECLNQSAEQRDATHFSLHGLWPLRKSYCGVAADMKARDRKDNWLDLPKLAMADDTADRLFIAMPGTKSGLDRHQWLRSGTCFGGTAQDYFSLQLRLLDELNASAVQALFAGRIGHEVSEAEIKEAFDRSFGAKAGDRVRMRCQKVGDRDLVTGLTIGLAGELEGKAGLSGLIQAAADTDFKCAKGIVDAAGIQ